MSEPLHIVLRCTKAVEPKVRYVLDTLLMAAGVPVVYADGPPDAGLWLYYGQVKQSSWPLDRCLALAYCPDSWQLFNSRRDIDSAKRVEGLAVVFPQCVSGFESKSDIPFDIVANAFYFLSSWSERLEVEATDGRRHYANSVFARLDIPQDIVDQYLDRLLISLNLVCDRLGAARFIPHKWPGGSSFALVLSHDVDFISTGMADIWRQGAKSVLRQLVRLRSPVDAFRAAAGLTKAILQRRDPYSCVPEIIEREKQLGTCSSFQVAVGHRHPADVNYRIEDRRVRDYLRVICDSGFDLCLHGSYRSTENPAWYAEEVALLGEHLAPPRGSRQHYLSFDYDTLFRAQEGSGIQYDMSMGFPDRPGPRAGFSYPYFPYFLDEDRPFDVVQISLFLMDVTLSGYLRLKSQAAADIIQETLTALQHTRGCVSAVWHPIVFGGARDPGYDLLFWEMVQRVGQMGGLATDGRTINEHWRNRAGGYPSFN